MVQFLTPLHFTTTDCNPLIWPEEDLLELIHIDRIAGTVALPQPTPKKGNHREYRYRFGNTTEDQTDSNESNDTDESSDTNDTPDSDDANTDGDDEDGVSDSDEIANGMTPTIPIQQRWYLRWRRANNRTNPNDEDSDDDGISDGDELIIGSDPNDAGSDDDGLNDGDEIANGTDPNDEDTDGME